MLIQILLIIILFCLLIYLKDIHMHLTQLFGLSTWFKSAKPMTQERPETMALSIRPSSQNRKFASKHLQALEYANHSDHLNLCLFNARHRDDSGHLNRTTWHTAKAWWKELYGNTIANEATQIPEGRKKLDEWFHTHCNRPGINPNQQKAIEIICDSYHHITKPLNQDELKSAQRSIKNHLRSLHPDKYGDASAAILLIEWKSLLSELEYNLSAHSKLPFLSLNAIYSPYAKPWLVVDLFIQHQMVISKQYHQNETLFIHRNVNDQQKRIQKNALQIQRNDDVIETLESQLWTQSTTQTQPASYFFSLLPKWL
jgi:hypothetical protein